MANVVIENQDFEMLIRHYDRLDAFFYADPPYFSTEDMFSVPRGYADGFNQWCKQVAAICLTAFMQTTLLFLGLLTFPDHMLLGLGIMLAANGWNRKEVSPRGLARG